MFISVNTLSKAINEKRYIRPEEIVKIVTVMVTGNNNIQYQVIDGTNNITYYNEYTIPVSIIKLINYNRPVKTWTRDNRQFFQYTF